MKVSVAAVRKTRRAVREEKPVPIWRYNRNSKENAQTVDIGEISLVPLPEARDTRNPSDVRLMA